MFFSYLVAPFLTHQNIAWLYSHRWQRRRPDPAHRQEASGSKLRCCKAVRRCNRSRRPTHRPLLHRQSCPDTWLRFHRWWQCSCRFPGSWSQPCRPFRPPVSKLCIIAILPIIRYNYSSLQAYLQYQFYNNF